MKILKTELHLNDTYVSSQFSNMSFASVFTILINTKKFYNINKLKPRPDYYICFLKEIK